MDGCTERTRNLPWRVWNTWWRSSSRMHRSFRSPRSRKKIGEHQAFNACCLLPLRRFCNIVFFFNSRFLHCCLVVFSVMVWWVRIGCKYKEADEEEEDGTVSPQNVPSEFSRLPRLPIPPERRHKDRILPELLLLRVHRCPHHHHLRHCLRNPDGDRVCGALCGAVVPCPSSAVDVIGEMNTQGV